MAGQRKLGINLLGMKSQSHKSLPDANPGVEDDLKKLVLELKAEVEKLRSTKGRRRFGSGGKTDGYPTRSADGKIICYYCKKPGHMARNCRDNPDSVARSPKKDASDDGSKTPSPPETKALPAKMISTTTDIQVKGIDTHPPSAPVLRLDLSQMVIEEVQCGEVMVKAMIDTGAAVSVIAHNLVKLLSLSVTTWMGPQIAMANGQPGRPLGAVDLEMKHPRGQAVGKALVMEMDDYSWVTTSWANFADLLSTIR